jgi:hypothetical protein
LFLERRSYTQRRIVDGARVLPILGLVLWMIPLIWPRSGAPDTMESSTSTLYIFAIWCILIVIGGFIAMRIGPINETPAPKPNADSDQSQSKHPQGRRPE